jgi:hypothetical protein
VSKTLKGTFPKAAYFEYTLWVIDFPPYPTVSLEFVIRLYNEVFPHPIYPIRTTYMFQFLEVFDFIIYDRIIELNAYINTNYN